MRPSAPYLLWMGVAALLLLCAVPGAVAQLTEHCTVSVLNRNVQVNPDGSWVLPNVPANFGQVRARATCVQDGVTTSGESTFFTLPANGVVNLPEIVLGTTTQVPASLSITPGRVSFTAAGQTAQLMVTATYPDRSVQDVTAANTGTSYTTSNPALVTVSAAGLVTAVASGTVVIQAIHDGAAGLSTATVALSSTDTDGDGIPDDVELALGLNPNNPIDAQEDFDRDGLTNLQESLRGTNMRVADTDGDGLTDGQDVTLGTNPLLADTDGDGIRDGLEVQTSSDPLDPTSFNLAQALTALEVIPANFIITVNTILGEASRQLTVTGHLRDGTTIDLTSAAKRTNYTSSNLATCNFGAPDGRVFGGTDGTCTITVTNSGFSVQAIGTVKTFTPTPLSFISIPGFANNVDVSGNFAYVAAGVAGLQIVDVTDRRAPRIVASLDTPGNANDVQIVGNRAYVADGSAGLHIIDITDPIHPQLLGALDTPGDASDVAVAGTLVFIADGPSGLQIVDASNPTALRGLGSVGTSGTAKGVAVAGNLAVVANGSAGIQVIDVTDHMHPMILSQSAGGDARDVVISGNFAFVADFSQSFTSIDLSDPRHPVRRTSTPGSTGGLLQDVALAGRFAFGADVVFVNGVPIIDVSTPAIPVSVAILDFRTFRDDNGTGITADSSFVYLTAERGLGTENGTVGDTRLYIGQYLVIEDTAGMPPTVSITAPGPSDMLIEGQTITLRAEATDDIAVASVSFLVNGQVVFTDPAAPFETSFPVPIGTTSLTIGAQAVDFGNNVGTAGDVVVTILFDPPPTVAITSPSAGVTVIAGERVTISADATDDTRVVSVLFTVNGGSLPLDTTLPFSTSFTVPLEIQTLIIEATAMDNLGKIVRATRTVPVILDPGTTVVGRVVDPDGHPANGATITCLGISGLTGADGTFSLPGVPTIHGDVQCTAIFITPDGKLLTRTVDGGPPVRGGTTAVGTIAISPAGVLFSARPGTVGVPGSGIELAAATDQVGTSVFQEIAGGSNQLMVDGLALGLQPDSNLDALDVLADGSFLFSTDFGAQGVPGSAVEQARNTGLRPANVYRSTGNGTNTLFLSGDALGILSFSDTSLDALALLPDGSVLFSVQPGGRGAPGSALAVSPQQTRTLDIFRSVGNGTNALFRSAADLGLVSGDLTGLAWNADGTLLFSVASGTQGVPGSAVAAAAPATLRGNVFRTASDGTNTLFRSQAAFGITSGSIDALASSPPPTADHQGIAPTVTILEPLPGQEVIEGDTLRIRLAVSDDVAVAATEVVVGGTTVASLAFPRPALTMQTTVPLGPGPLHISALATDLGSTTSTTTVVVTVIPDPETTVVGRVVDLEGHPAAGATVTCLGVAGFTDSAGAFSIPGVPTIRGDVKCTITFVTPEGETLANIVTGVLPVRGGITDVAQIQLLVPAGVGMVVDFATKAVIVFDATTDTVVGTVAMGSGPSHGDCSMTADGTRGFVTDLSNRIWVIDLTTSPPSLASGQNPIPVTNPGADTSISPDGQSLVVCGGSFSETVSVIDIATQTQISTFSLGATCNSVEVLRDGSVLTTSFNTGRVRRLTIDSAGNLTDTGEALVSNSPINVYGAPGATSGFVISYVSNAIQSFIIPGLTPVDTRSLSGSGGGIAGLVHPAGDRIYVRSDGGAVDVFAYNSVTGALGTAPLFSIPTASAISFLGMDQMAITPDGSKLYVPQPHALVVYDANTGHLLRSITHPDIVQPTGVCLTPAGAQ